MHWVQNEIFTTAKTEYLLNISFENHYKLQRYTKNSTIFRVGENPLIFLRISDSETCKILISELFAFRKVFNLLSLLLSKYTGTKNIFLCLK